MFLDSKSLRIWKETKESPEKTMTSDVARRKTAFERLAEFENIFCRDTCHCTENSAVHVDLRDVKISHAKMRKAKERQSQ